MHDSTTGARFGWVALALFFVLILTSVATPVAVGWATYDKGLNLETVAPTPAPTAAPTTPTPAPTAAPTAEPTAPPPTPAPP